MKKGKIIGMMMLSIAFVGALASCGVTNSSNSNNSNVINVPSATDGSKVSTVAASETANDALDNKTEIIVDSSYRTIENQLSRASRLDLILRNHKNS